MEYTAIERKVIEMIRRGEKLHGLAREIAIDLQLDGRMPKELGRWKPP